MSAIQERLNKCDDPDCKGISNCDCRIRSNPSIGDYVLATKWSDGDPGDNWAVGFYDGERRGWHYVINGDGKQIRANGFRRVGNISPEMGYWLLQAAGALECSPPGTVNLWNMINFDKLQYGETKR